MGYMQVYRVGNSRGDSPLGKISRLLTGEGIDCDELGNQRPETGCVLIDFTTGEERVHQVAGLVPQLPQILATSTLTLGAKQLEICDEFVSSDMPDEEIIRRVNGMQNMALRIVEDVPEPKATRVLLDGEAEEDDAPLKSLSKILNNAEIEWRPLKDNNDLEGTGLVYSYYRQSAYARMLQKDYPGYVHIQMAPTPELRVEALTVGDISYTPRTTAEEITTRHTRLLKMIERLRNPKAFFVESAKLRALNVLFVGDRNVGNNLKNGMGEEINLKTIATVAGGLTEAEKHHAVLIQLGGRDDAKERFSFLQMLLKKENHPALALLFLTSAPDQIRSFCEKQGVTVIESKNSEEVQQILLGLRP